MVDVIINADDLGLNSLVNANIFDALKNRYVTSATILANSEYWNEIHEVVLSCPQASFGVHLNLTEGKALTNSAIFKSLGVVDKDNYFTKNIRLQNLSDKQLLDDVYDEWDAQLNKIICQEGIEISHVDGHHHIHAYYEFNPILISLLEKYKINHVRNRCLYPIGGGKRLLKNSINRIATRKIYHVLKSSSLKLSTKPINVLSYHVETSLWNKIIGKRVIMSDYFDSYEHFITQVSEGYKPKDGELVELMCHPGHDNYKHEYEMVKSYLLQELLTDMRLISYKDL